MGCPLWIFCWIMTAVRTVTGEIWNIFCKYLKTKKITVIRTVLFPNSEVGISFFELFRCHLPVTSSSRNDVASAWFRESYYYPLPSVFKYCVLYDWVVFILAAGRQDWSFLVAMATSCYEGVTYGIIVLMHFFFVLWLAGLFEISSCA